MANNNQITGNKGEWSEFYAFIKILTDRKLFAADENLQKLQEKFFIVLKIIREEAKTGKKTYDISANEKKILIFDEKGSQIGSVDSDPIKNGVVKIFNQMKAASSASFSVSFANGLMRDLQCTQIKASSGRKADLILKIYDRIAPDAPELGFSIKSTLGSPSTLLNASSATNFLYSLGYPAVVAERTKESENYLKIRDRIKEIKQTRGFIFEGLENKTFKKNLAKIDTIFPEIMSEILLAYYEGKGLTLDELVSVIDGEGTLKNKYGLDKGDLEFKIKNFLVSVALGMTPNTEWDGFTKAHGGYIVVKDDGEVVCYQLYNRDEFQSYLYKNTKLDTPSTSRHQFGTVYEENGKSFIKLNLQIRFIR